jgi:hypothetical protein
MDKFLGGVHRRPGEIRGLAYIGYSPLPSEHVPEAFAAIRDAIPEGVDAFLMEWNGMLLARDPSVHNIVTVERDKIARLREGWNEAGLSAFLPDGASPRPV